MITEHELLIYFQDTVPQVADRKAEASERYQQLNGQDDTLSLFSQLKNTERDAFIKMWHSHLLNNLSLEQDQIDNLESSVSSQVHIWKIKNYSTYLGLKWLMRVAAKFNLTFAYFSFKVVDSLFESWGMPGFVAILFSIIGIIYNSYVDYNLIDEKNVDAWISAWYRFFGKNRNIYEKVFIGLNVALFLFSTFTVCVFGAELWVAVFDGIKNVFNVQSAEIVLMLDFIYWVLVIPTIVLSCYYYLGLSLLDCVNASSSLMRYLNKCWNDKTLKVPITSGVSLASFVSKVCFLLIFSLVNGAMSMYIVAKNFPLLNLPAGIEVRLWGFLTTVWSMMSTRWSYIHKYDEQFYPACGDHNLFQEFYKKYKHLIKEVFNWPQTLLKVVRLVFQPLTLGLAFFLLFNQALFDENKSWNYPVSLTLGFAMTVINAVSEAIVITKEAAARAFLECKKITLDAYKSTDRETEVGPATVWVEHSERTNTNSPETTEESKCKQVCMSIESTFFSPKKATAGRESFRYFLFFMLLVADKTLADIVPGLSDANLVSVAIPVSFLTVIVEMFYVYKKLAEKQKENQPAMLLPG